MVQTSIGMDAVGVGKRVPPVILGAMFGDEIVARPLERLLLGRRAVIIGVPGAFTPVCTTQHVPGLIASADRLSAGGVSLLVCITPNDPWTTAAWARTIDPDHKLLFLSDGNLALSNALGATMRDTEHFMGQRNRRYLMQTRDAVIDRLSIETSPLALTCTRAQDVLLD
jgi:2-Cys peroxiredoxin 5